jgi:OmpA-OmpF porin, OOP family
MCDWRRWIWPGIFATLFLGAFAVWFRAAPVETELTTLASSALTGAHPWAKVELDGRDLTLTGTAPSEEAQKDAAKLALAAYDVRVVNNKAGLIEMADPYVFGALKATDGVTLTGNVPDEVTRVELVAKAQAAMPGIVVSDKLTLARGAPAGFAALAGFALDQLPRFTTGEVALNNAALAVNGVTDTPEIFAEAQAALTGTLPEGLTVATSTIVPPAAPAAVEPAAVEPAAAEPVAAAATTTVLTVEPQDAKSGEAVTLTATVAAPEGAPSGSIMFMDGSTAIGFEPLVGGVATLTRPLSDGDHALSARYLGAEAFAASESAAAPFAVAAKPAEPAPEPVAAEPAAVSPYIWSVSRDGDKITVEGYAPTAEAAAANVAEASKFGTVEDKQEIAPGAPATYAAATAFGIQSLATLKTGVASLTDAALAITGEAPNLGAKLDVDANVPTAAPEGVTVAAKITAPAITNYKWQAVKSVGGTTLSGFVPSLQAKALSVRKAASVAEPVRDSQVLGAGAPGNYAAVVTSALDALKPLTKGTATFEDRILSVVGVAPDLGVELKVESDLRKAGFRYDITSPAITPYVWKAEKAADAITISGLAPSPEMKSFNVKKAGNTIANVTDNQTLANGAPANYSGATVAGLSALGRLLNGTAEFADGKLNVTGAAATQAIKTEVENALRLAGHTNTITAPAEAAPVVEAKPASEPTVKAPEVQVVVPDICPELIKRVIGPRYVNFETDSAVIIGNKSAELDEVLFVAQTCPAVRFGIDGHTDSRARDAYNQTLSEARAASVLAWMVERGVPAERFTSQGFGETKPLADNNTDEGKALNRRIEIRALN